IVIPACFRQKPIAPRGSSPRACFASVKRSSSAAAISSPSRNKTAAPSWWPCLIPELIPITYIFSHTCWWERARPDVEYRRSPREADREVLCNWITPSRGSITPAHADGIVGGGPAAQAIQPSDGARSLARDTLERAKSHHKNLFSRPSSDTANRRRER